MLYQEVEPTFSICRDRGIWLAVVRYGTYDGRPETYEATPCFTAWGARRRGRREVERIKRERNDPLNVLIARAEDIRARWRANESDPVVLAEYRQVLTDLRSELDRSEERGQP